MASPVDTSVKFFNEGMPGAPVDNGVAGSRIALLEACLVTGFGARTATSLVVASGVATMTLASDAKNPALQGSVVLVAGVTGPLVALNGEQKVVAATATALTFATAAADGTAAGTITVKTASAGWAKTFTGTNKAEFHIIDPAGSGRYLRVDDSGTTTCQVRAYEAMSDVDTGTGPHPTVAESATGIYWQKSSAANSTANKWDLFADSRAFILSPAANSGGAPTAVGQAHYFFGDALPHRSIDVYASVVTGGASAPNGNASYGSIASYGLSNGIGRYPRPSAGVGASAAIFLAPECGVANSYSGLDTFLGAFPPPDGKLRLSRVLANEVAAIGVAGTVPRAVIPGFIHVPQTALNLAFQRGDRVVPNDGPLAGRGLFCVMASASFTETVSTGGRAFVDVTGPWR